jgi:hypothetical protein
MSNIKKNGSIPSTKVVTFSDTLVYQASKKVSQPPKEKAYDDEETVLIEP